MHKMKGSLEKNDIPTFLCEPVPGKDIVEVTKDGRMGTQRQTWQLGVFYLFQSTKKGNSPSGSFSAVVHKIWGFTPIAG